MLFIATRPNPVLDWEIANFMTIFRVKLFCGISRRCLLEKVYVEILTDSQMCCHAVFIHIQRPNM